MLQFKKGIFTFTTFRSAYILDNEKQQYYNCTTKKLLQTAPPVSADFFEIDKVWCREMGKTPKKVNSFLREYGETSKAITQWQIKALDEKISKNMNEIREKLFYEDDEFITILPTTNQELVKEGNDMHHCVGSYGQKVADKKGYVVFIRKKESPDKCYITAEVRPSGKIGQYYLAYDHTITEDKDIQFYKKYQEHLKKLLVLIFDYLFTSL